MKPHYDSMFEIKNLMPAENCWQAELKDDDGELTLVVKRVLAFAVVASRQFDSTPEDVYADDWVAPLSADEVMNVATNLDYDWIRVELAKGRMDVIYAHTDRAAWEMAKQLLGRDTDGEIKFMHSDRYVAPVKVEDIA